jgi:AcrR family transcriptional regulator
MVYRRTARTEARKAAARRHLIEVARGIVAEGGFQDLQIATVAGIAGVAAGTVYRYFPSKADLGVEVFRRVCDREVEVATEIARADGSAVERLQAAARAVAGRAVRGRKIAYALIAEPVHPALDAERLVYRRALAGAFEAIIADGISAGEFPAQNAEVAGACVVGALMEALVSPLAPDAGALMGGGEPLLAALARFCLGAVCARASTAEGDGT